MAESHLTCSVCPPKFPKLGFYNAFSDVNLDVPDQEFDLGNGRKTKDQEEAYYFVLERDFPDYNFEDEKQTEVLFTPPVFVHQRMDISLTPKGIRAYTMNMIDNLGTKGKLEGDDFEEQVFNNWKSFLTSLEIQPSKNITVIQGWKREWTNLKQEPKPKGGKGEEHDFIIIDGNSKLIILVEAKKTLKSGTVKNAKLQLTQQVEYIRDYHGHVLTKEWKIATVIAYEELQVKNLCQNCSNFLLGPQEFENLKSWWENLGATLKSHVKLEPDENSFQPEQSKNCYKKLLARIIGFSSSCFKYTMKSVRDEVSTALKGNADLVSAGPSKELADQKKGHMYPRMLDKVGDERIKLLLDKSQRALLMGNDCKFLLLGGTYGSGKSLLLRLKALELAAQGEKVAFLVGGLHYLAKKFSALAKQDFENTKVKFIEKLGDYHNPSDIAKLHKNGYHVFWDECFLRVEDLEVKKLKLDSMKGYFWIAASTHISTEKYKGMICDFDDMFKQVDLTVCFRNSPAIQQFEKWFRKRTIEEIKRNPLQQESGDLPGK
jgi:hypothetical protein